MAGLAKVAFNFCVGCSAGAFVLSARAGLRHARGAVRERHEPGERRAQRRRHLHPRRGAPWSVAEWAVALRFDIPRTTVRVLVSG